MEESNTKKLVSDIITDSEIIPLDNTPKIITTDCDGTKTIVDDMGQSESDRDEIAAMTNNESTISTDLQINIVVTNTSEESNVQSITTTEVQQVDESTYQSPGSTQPKNVLLSSEAMSIDLLDGTAQNNSVQILVPNEFIHPLPCVT